MSAPRLVVNADDLGLSAGVNDGVLRAHRDGVVTSASLMVRAPAAHDAVRAAADHPGLALGLHLDLGEWERRAGAWRRVYAVVDPDDAGAVTAELRGQLERFRALTGRDPTHLDSHQHVHRDGPARAAAQALADELGVPLRGRSAIRYCGAFYGQDRDGRPIDGALRPAALTAIVDELGPGATELCCHPAAALDFTSAYRIERLRELRALCDPSVRARIAARGVALVSFAQLA